MLFINHVSLPFGCYSYILIRTNYFWIYILFFVHKFAYFLVNINRIFAFFFREYKHHILEMFKYLQKINLDPMNNIWMRTISKPTSYINKKFKKIFKLLRYTYSFKYLKHKVKNFPIIIIVLLCYLLVIVPKIFYLNYHYFSSKLITYS